jgi:hypothetical protein
MTFETASYEVQSERWLTHGRTYPVRVTPIPAGTWCLQAQTHKYRPYLRYWAMVTVPDSRNPLNDTGFSTWTLWFVFPEPPMEHLDRIYQDGRVKFLAEAEAPHHLFVPGFTFDLFVGPGGTIARGQILETHDAA